MEKLKELEDRAQSLKQTAKRNSQVINNYNVTITDLERAERLLGIAMAKIMNRK